MMGVVRRIGLSVRIDFHGCVERSVAVLLVMLLVVRIFGIRPDVHAFRGWTPTTVVEKKHQHLRLGVIDEHPL